MRTKTILLYGVLFSLYCIIMFVIPSTFTPTFWAGVIFTQVSFGYCVIVWLYYFRQEHEQHCRFLKIPVVMLANSYLCLQITVSVLGKFIITMPIWVTIVTSLLLLAFSIINLVSIDNTYEYINEIDSVLSSKTTYLKRLQNKVESVLESQTDDKVKKTLINSRRRYSI